MTKVMLVEDDNNLREIYEARLQAEGYDIVAAKDGEEALVLAKEHKPELVISDVMMPKISGFEMLDILRNTEGLKDVKVIMLTALGQSDDQARADKLGADRYLVKSQVTLEDIVTVARELIEGNAAPAPEQAPVAPIAAPPVTATPLVEPMTVAPEPVVAAPPAPIPAPDPTSVLAPEPVLAAPAPEPATVIASDNSATQSTAQEEAAVEAKIEDFVTGASNEPGTQQAVAAEPDAVVVESVTTPTPEVVTEPMPAPQTANQIATASDDKLMAAAVDSLVANTEESTEPELPTVIEPTPAPAAPAIAIDKTPELVQPPAEPGSVPISGKKVISPVDDGTSKPSLEALLAEEEAKNIQAGAIVAPVKPVTPTTVISPGDADPNNIAL